MSEHVVTSTDYIEANFEHFLGDDSPETTQKYRDSGLIPTHALSLLFLDSSQIETAPGEPNPLDYHVKPYGSIVKDFIETNTELARRARQIANATQTSAEALNEALNRGDLPARSAATAAYRNSYWAEARVFTEVFLRLGPMMQAAGFDPIDACK